ncbi:MAG: MATE family efflux transporter [Bacteroidota bacterium]
MKNWLSILRAAVRGDEHDFTKGNINVAIVLLAVPMMLEMAMESIFALVDTLFVGRVGVAALTTVGLTEVVMTLVYSIAIGISTAPMAMVARFIGEKDPANAARAARQAMWMAIGMSLLIGIPGFFYAEDILRLMGASDAVVEQGKTYTQIMFASNIVIMLLFLLNGIFRGAGEAAKAMRVLWLSNGINIVLDPILIFGLGPFPELGVTGAAVATCIGRGTGVLYQLYLLFGDHSVIKLKAGKWGLDWNMLSRLGKIASNGAFQYLIASASWVFLMRIISDFGDGAVAGYTVAIRLIIFTLLPAWGLANATATFVGQNLGAKQANRAETGVWRAARVTTIYMFIVGAIYVIGAPWLVGAFTADPVAIAPGIQALRIFGLGYVLFGYGMVLVQSFNGSGDTRTPTYINIISFWIIEIPLGYFLGSYLGYGVPGVCAAVVIAEGILSGIAYVLFRRGRWKTTVV